MSTILCLWATASVFLTLGILIGRTLSRKVVIEQHRHFHVTKSNPHHERFKMEFN